MGPSRQFSSGRQKVGTELQQVPEILTRQLLEREDAPSIISGDDYPGEATKQEGEITNVGGQEGVLSPTHSSHRLDLFSSPEVPILTEVFAMSHSLGAGLKRQEMQQGGARGRERMLGVFLMSFCHVWNDILIFYTE